MKELLKKYRIGSRVLALVISVVLWAVVLEVDNPDRDKDFSNIPVEFLNHSRLTQNYNLVVSEVSADAVSVTITGQFQKTRNVSAEDVKAYADVSSYTEPGVYDLHYVISSPDGTSVKSRSPEKIRVTVEEIVEKELPVQLVYEGKLPENVVLEGETLSLETVLVSGTSSEMAKASAALIRLDASKLTSGFAKDCSYEIVDAEGNVLENAYTRYLDPTVFVEVESYLTKTVPFEVTVISSSGVAKASVQVKCYPAEVTIYGRTADLQKINSINIGSVNARDFVMEYDAVFDVELPENVTFYEDAVEEVAVRVDLLDVETKQIEIDNIVLTGLTEENQELVTLETQSMEILVRCGKDKVKGIDPENFKVTVDLSEVDLVPGRHIVPVQVKSGIGGYDVCGDYSVVIVVEEPEPVEGAQQLPVNER